MNILDLIQQNIKDEKVEWKPLGEVGEFTRGNGMQKKDFKERGFPAIHYGQIYTKYGLSANKAYSFVDNELAEKLRIADKNDLLIATTSENDEDVCKSVAWLGGKVAISGDMMFFRSNENVKYLMYYFRSQVFQKEKQKYITGTKVRRVSATDMAKIKIPIPSLEIQQKVVEILDKMTDYVTELTAELTAELTLRQKQYSYYRDKLLIFGTEDNPLSESEESVNVKWKTLLECCDYVDYRGKTPKKVDSGIFLVTAKNIRPGYIDYDKSSEFISEEDYENVMRRGYPKIGDILITTEAPMGNIAQIDRENIALAQRVIKYRPKNSKELNSTFLKHYLLGKEFQVKLNAQATGGTVKGIKGSRLHQMTVPIPPLNVQNEIVKVLDKFEKLVSDLTEGLPREISLRQEQYEYWRGRLMNFEIEN